MRSSLEKPVRPKLFAAIDPDTMAHSASAVLVVLVRAETVDT